MLSGPWNTAPITHATQCNSHTTYLMAQQIRLMPLVNLVCKISILVQPVQHKPYPAPPARLWIAFVLINNAQPDCGPRLPISIIPPDTLTTVSHHARADEFCLFASFHSKTEPDKQTDKGFSGLVDNIYIYREKKVSDVSNVFLCLVPRSKIWLPGNMFQPDLSLHAKKSKAGWGWFRKAIQ